MTNNVYVERIEKAIQYIESNLQHKISLDNLSEMSHFSKYHFSRIFTSIVGMTPIAYLTDARLRRAICYLTDSDKSIQEISGMCGFESAASFNVAFKRKFNQTPSEARNELLNNRNISKSFSNKPKENIASPQYAKGIIDNNFLRRIWAMNMTIKELPPIEVAYVRHVGSYLETYTAWGQLGDWASQHGLHAPEYQFIGISLDDAGAVEENKCRYDACVTIPQHLERTHHETVQFKTLPGGLYGLFSFYDTVDKLAITYQSIFGQWLPNSEYDADDRDCLEFCMNNPFDDAELKAKVDLYVPLRVRVSEADKEA